MATTPAKNPAAGGATKRAARGAGKAAGASAALASAGADAPMDAGASGPDSATVEVKLKDLVERVAAATGAKRPQVRSVIDAMLKEMGDALVASQVLNLPGFGKLRVVRQAETPSGTMTIKLRRGNAGGERAGGERAGGAKPEAGAEPLAEPGEDS